MSGGFGVRLGCRRRLLRAGLLLLIIAAETIYVTILCWPPDMSQAERVTDTTALRETYCPETFEPRGTPGDRTRIGMLVPTAPVGGLVCTYAPNPDSDVVPLTGSLPLRRHVAEVAWALNALPTGPLAGQQGARPTVVCGQSDVYYAVVFLYGLSAKADTVVVWVHPGCGLVGRDGDVRSDRGVVASRMYW